MGGLNVWEILVILVIILIIFGAGKLPKVMGDLGRGIRSFKSGMSDPEGDVARDRPASSPPAPVRIDETTTKV
ncbi:twin-arginine translocase TatA/TatE family subunit [Niveispirillum fermenti]|uniref:twin-arginine translocase TatA/TatE family subunit n=1 Tax=Niveispirillum fermenti TaxID=1233113 RepID=UPI003A8B2DF1